MKGNVSSARYGYRFIFYNADERRGMWVELRMGIGFCWGMKGNLSRAGYEYRFFFLVYRLYTRKKICSHTQPYSHSLVLTFVPLHKKKRGTVLQFHVFSCLKEQISKVSFQLLSLDIWLEPRWAKISPGLNTDKLVPALIVNWHLFDGDDVLSFSNYLRSLSPIEASTCFFIFIESFFITCIYI